MRTPTPLQGSAPASTPVAATPIAQGQQLSLDALQTRIAQLNQQLASLKAEREVVSDKLNEAPPGDAHNALEAQHTQLEAQITQGEMQLESAKALMASRLGVESENIGPAGTIVIPKPYVPRRGPDPDMVVGLSFALLMCIALPLSIAYARRLWRGFGKDAPAAKKEDSAPRLDRLEQAVDAVAIEIERIAEGQRFVTKILAERPSQVAPSQAAASAEPALNDAKPFLALGAGPMEPVRASERQPVRQSITPH